MLSACAQTDCLSDAEVEEQQAGGGVRDDEDDDGGRRSVKGIVKTGKLFFCEGGRIETD